MYTSYLLTSRTYTVRNIVIPRVMRTVAKQTLCRSQVYYSAWLKGWLNITSIRSTSYPMLRSHHCFKARGSRTLDVLELILQRRPSVWLLSKFKLNNDKRRITTVLQLQIKKVHRYSIIERIPVYQLQYSRNIVLVTLHNIQTPLAPFTRHESMAQYNQDTS